MNKTKEQLIENLNHTQWQMNIYPEKYAIHDILQDSLKHNEFYMYQIQHNCINNSCPNYDTIEYKGHTLHVCYDDWSSIKLGWHVLYFETCDICVENKGRKIM